MGIKLTFECSGCWESVEGTDRLHRRFHGFNGHDYGFGHWVTDDPRTLAPEGWIAFDPYTQCTYCPKCWAEIDAPDTAEAPAEASNQESVP